MVSKAQMIVSVIEAYPGLSRARAGAIADAVLQIITKQLLEEGSFSLPGVGTLLVSQRAARKGFNPRTREELKIVSRKVVRIRTSSLLDAYLNDKSADL